MVIPDGDATPTPQAFLNAVDAGKRQTVDTLLRASPELIHSTNAHGEGVLHMCAVSGRVRLLLDLISKGANVNLPDRNGNTPAHKAALNGKDGMVIWLWKKGANLDTLRNQQGQSVLDIASVRVRKVMCRTEAQLLPIPTMASNMKAARGDVMRFADAAERGDVDTIRGMLDVHTDNHQATQELLESRGLNGKNPLHLAVEHHHPKVVNVLLKAGSDPDAEEEYMNTPLIIAANYSSDRPEIVRALVTAGAKVDCVSMFGLVPLLIAAENGFLEVVKVMVEEANCDINIRGSFGNTALHMAVMNKHYATIKYLYERRADVTVLNDEAQTPLDLSTPHIRFLLTDGKEGVENVAAEQQSITAPRSEWQRDYYEKSLLSGNDALRIDPSTLNTEELVGGGTFGEVYRGWWSPSSASATSTLSTSSSSSSSSSPPSSSSSSAPSSCASTSTTLSTSLVLTASSGKSSTLAAPASSASSSSSSSTTTASTSKVLCTPPAITKPSSSSSAAPTSHHEIDSASQHSAARPFPLSIRAIARTPRPPSLQPELAGSLSSSSSSSSSSASSSAHRHAPASFGQTLTADPIRRQSTWWDYAGPATMGLLVAAFTTHFFLQRKLPFFQH